MSKIKPYHETLDANAYVVDVGNSTNLPLRESKNGTNKCSIQNNNHHTGSSTYSYNKRELHKFYKGEKVVRKYLPYKQGVTPIDQQNWVGPYTITRVHDDNTIQIQNKYQKDMGRWKSNRFLLYDSINPDQVVTINQDVMEALTPPNYDEVHHKMLECYSIRPIRKETIDEKSTNGVNTTRIEEIFTQLLTKGDYFKMNTPNIYLSENTSPNTLYEAIINNNIYDKYKVHTKYKTANELTTKWLQHMCAIWCISFIQLVFKTLYLHPRDSSSHSYIQTSTMQIKDTKITENFNGPGTTLRHPITTVPNIQQNILQRPTFNFLNIKRITNQKEISQKEVKSTMCKTTTPYQHIRQRMTTTPTSHLRNYLAKRPSWNAHLTSRRVTELPESIITQTTDRTLTTERPRLFLKELPSLSSFLQPLREKFVKSLSELQESLAMRTPGKEKGKASQMRAVDDIVFSTEMSAMDFEPSRKEETFLQLIGLDRFVTRVTWEMLNVSVVREVITNLNLDTMESALNGQVFPLFSKDWRNRMRVVFYLTQFSAKREPGTPKVAAADIFPSFGEKTKSKAGACKVAECTIPEAKRPLRFFNSLLLLRTSTHSIPCQYITHIADALNGKSVDWPAVFREIIETELKNLKHELFKDKSALLKSMVGPPITMLLMDEGLLSVQQEIDAGFLETSVLQDKIVPSSKKRKHDTEMELLGTEKGEPSYTKGNSSTQGEKPQVLVATVEPTVATMELPVARMEPPMHQTVLISTSQNGTPQLDKTPLKEILQTLTHTSHLLEKWLTGTPHPDIEPEHKRELNLHYENQNPKSQNQISELETKIRHLQTNYNLAEKKISEDAAAAQLRIQELQQNHDALKKRYTATEETTRQAAEINKAQIEDYRIKNELLQAQHTTTIQQHQQAMEQEQQKFLKQRQVMQTDLQNRTSIAAIAAQQLCHLRHSMSEIRKEATAKFEAFQQEVETCKTHMKSAIHTTTEASPDRVQEIAKMEAFDLWVQEKTDSDHDNAFSARTLLHRVTTKINHTLKTLKTELRQATTERDDLQEKLEQQEEDSPEYPKWNDLLGLSKTEDPGNLITATMKNLPPPISIYQYYQAYKPMIFNTSNLPDLKLQTHLSKEQFQILWAQANSGARDLLTFMWALKDLTVPKGVVEITATNSTFYITRFCIRALTHINHHHEEFYTNIDNRNSLPQIEPYDKELTKEIQEMANNQFPEFLSALDNLAGEDTTLLHTAIQQHQNLVRKFPDSFPPAFHRIQLHGYVTRALDDRKNTLEHRQISTPHARTLLYLPQYDPVSMKIAKRS